MKATSSDLRLHAKQILDAAMRGEEVVIMLRRQKDNPARQ